MFLLLDLFKQKKENLVLRLRKTKAKAQSELDRAVDDIVWAPLDEGNASHSSSSSAADRDAAFSGKVVAPLLGAHYLLLPRVVAVPPGLRLSLEEQLAAKGRGSRRKRRRKGPGEEAEGPSLEGRGALLPNAALPGKREGDPELLSSAAASSSSSLCVELKPKCGLPHGHGRRTKVRLKQQQLMEREPCSSSTHRSTYCPSDLFSLEPARRKRALNALVTDALARDFSHTAPRAAHFRLFDAEGEALEGAGRAAEAVSELLLLRGGESALSSSKEAATPPSQKKKALKLLVDALDSILSFEPLLPRLLEAQRCPECPTAAMAAESLSVLRQEVEAVAGEKKKTKAPSASAAAAAAASSLRSYLTATSARDLSVMILLRRGRGEDDDDGENNNKKRSFLQRDTSGGAVEFVPSPPSLSSLSSQCHRPRPPPRLLLRYRISLCDLDAKPSSKAELHAAADEKYPRSGARRRGEK